jgi:hypothetical protein
MSQHNCNMISQSASNKKLIFKTRTNKGRMSKREDVQSGESAIFVSKENHLTRATGAAARAGTARSTPFWLFLLRRKRQGRERRKGVVGVHVGCVVVAVAVVVGFCTIANERKRNIYIYNKKAAHQLPQVSWSELERHIGLERRGVKLG